MRVNLLARGDAAARAGASRLGAALTGALVAAALAAALAHLLVARLAWTLEARAAERRALEMQAAPAVRLRAEIGGLERRVRAAERLRAGGPRIEHALAALAARLPASSWLTMLEVTDDGALRLAGRAPSFSTVGAVLTELAGMPGGAAPSLLGAQRPGRTGMLRFQIETRTRRP
ncbi:MAG TPA: PilN domain-containing protein [Candidatus Dormibacteraeota bacterium]|nr:PilN domain-containing protein [Candidatus Dormibacteraeota bacterium]